MTDSECGTAAGDGAGPPDSAPASGTAGATSGRRRPRPSTLAFGVVPLVVVLGIGPALAVAAPGPVRVGSVPAVAVAAAATAAGVGLVVWTAATFARAGETLSPVGTPATLVTGGPMAHTRNPMYLGVLLAAAGQAVLFGSASLAAYTGALWVAYHALAVAYEEPKLEAAFGPEYEEYRRSVPRWLPLGGRSGRE